MCIIRMKSKTKRAVTTVPNLFIDKYMPRLNSSYIPVYLYLLRHYAGSSLAGRGAEDFSIQTMADRLDCTEADIRRALKALAKENLLEVTFDGNREVTLIELVDLLEESGAEEAAVDYVIDLPDTAMVSEAPAASAAKSSKATPEPSSDTTADLDYRAMERAFVVDNDIQDRFLADPAYAGLSDALQQLLGGPLGQDHYRLMLFAYAELHFPMDLIYYLFDYCTEIDKTSPRYMTKVALNWAEEGICTEEEARDRVVLFEKPVIAVREQFGLHRSLAKGQLAFILRWSREWGMPIELIEEACRRTISNTGEPSFPYAERILSDWHAQGFTSVADVSREDEAHRSDRPARTGKRSAASNGNLFTAYSQREYTDEEYAALELAMRQRH